MRFAVSPRALALAASLLVGTSGCAHLGDQRSAKAPISEEPAVILAAASGWQKWVVSDAAGALFLTAPRPELDRYAAYVIEPPLLHFKRLSAKPTTNQAIRLSDNLSKVIRQRVESSFGWKRASAPGPDVIRLRAQASNIEFAAPAVSEHTRTTALVSSGAMVHFILEFQDSETGEPLARYGARRPLPGGTFTGPSWHELDRARLVFRGFGIDMEPNLHALARN